MNKLVLVRGARQLITLRGPSGPRRGAECQNLGIIADGSVLIRDGRIVSVGPSRRIENLAEARSADVIEAHGMLVMPAFIDAGVRLGEDGAITRRYLQLAAMHGTAATGCRGEYSILRSIEPATGVPRVVPVLECGSADEAVVARARKRELVSFLRTDVNAFDGDGRRMLRALGVPLRLYSNHGTHGDWIGLAMTIGAPVLEISDDVRGAHRDLLADSEIIAVASASAPVSLRGLLDSGVALALSSGWRHGAGGGFNLLNLAVRACQEHGMDITEAITLVTINAAHALGLAETFGSIEIGKQADLLLLHVSDHRDLSSYAGVNIVAKYLKAGRVLV